MNPFVELRLGGSPALLGRRSAFPPAVKPAHALKSRILLERLLCAPATLDELRRRCDALGLPPTVRQLTDKEFVFQLRDRVDRGKLVFVSLGTSASTLVPKPYRPVGGANARPVSGWSTGEKIEEVLKRTLRLLPDETARMVEAMLSPEAVGAAVGTLVAIAAANAMGVGVVLDAALAAYAFYAAGAAGLRALTELVSATAGLISADSDDDLDRAAQAYAGSLVVLGTAFLQRFIKGARSRSDKVGGVSRMDGPGGGGGARPPARSNVPARKDYKAHNREGPADSKGFVANRGGKTKRSAADRKAELQLRKLGYDPETAAQVVGSGQKGSFKPVELAKGDELYAFTTTGKGKNSSSPYWMTKDQYQQVKSRFHDPATGAWDRHGVKQHLALPCYNKVDSFITGRVTRPHTALSSSVGEATETVIYRGGSTQHTMYGGGGQTSPLKGAIELLGEGTPP
ncbi:MAG TPA: hypothetical protein VF574_11805 [Allosphingosinicella sp.]